GRRNVRGNVGRLVHAADGHVREVAKQNRSGRIDEVVPEHFGAVDVDDDAVVTQRVQAYPAKLTGSRHGDLLAEVGGHILQVRVRAEADHRALGHARAVAITEIGDAVGPAGVVEPQ